MSENVDLYDRSRSVVVEAAAGAGKTYRLVRRYLAAVVLDGELADLESRIQRVAAVTFTRAAAGEMRGRVLREIVRPLSDVAADDPIVRACLEKLGIDGRKLLERALAGAPIDTLHGLCGRLLREFPERSGVVPDARVIEPEDDGIRCEQFIAHFLDPVLDDSNHVLHADVRDLLRERSQTAVREELLAIVGALREIPPEWADPRLVSDVRGAFGSGIRRDVLQALKPAAEAAAEALERYAQNRRTIPQVYAASKAATIRRLADPSIGADLDPDLAQVIDDVLTYGGIQAGRGDEARSAINAFNEARETARRVRGTIVKMNTVPDSGHADRIARLVRVGRAARDEYRRELERKGLLRYDDLERRALELLRDAGDVLRGRFTHLLVDEFQDTNQVQVRILEGLCGACGGVKTFYVGDPKQSIYRFRGAEVDVFEQQVKRAKDAGELVGLAESRRPSPALNAFFNAFFPRILGETSDFGPLNGASPIPSVIAIPDRAKVPWPDGGVTGTRLRADIKDPASPKPVHLLLREKGGTHAGTEVVAEAPDGDTDGEAGGGEQSRLARYLRQLLDESKLQENGMEAPRDLRPRDILILVPKWSVADKFRSELEAVGIAAQIAGGRGLRSLPEVHDLVNVIQYLANWRDDLATVGVLRGPMFAVSDLGLYVLARWPGVMRVTSQGEEPFENEAVVGPLVFPRSMHEVLRYGRLDPGAAVDALVQSGMLAESDRPDRLTRLSSDAAAIANGCERLAAIMADAGVRPTADLLADAIAGFRLEAHWLRSRDSERAIANAWKFVEIVRRVETDGPDPRRVVAWLDTDADPSPEGLIDADLDAVTITTAHGFKGQERPVVVLAGLGLKVGGHEGASFGDGAAPGLADPANRSQVPRMQIALGGFAAESDGLNEGFKALDAPGVVAEEKRLLYVGMTRARDRLVLSGELPPRTGRLGASEKRLAKEWLEGLNKNEVEGHPKPLFMLDDRTSLIVGGLGLECKDGVFRLPESSRWSKWVDVIEDAALLKATPERPAAAIEVSVDEQALAWRPTGRLKALKPSTAKGNKDSPSLSVWPSTSACAVPLPEGADARERGTLFHAAMEQWGFIGDVPDLARCAEFAERAFPGEGHQHANWLSACVRRMEESAYSAELRAAAKRGELFHEVPIDAVLDDTHRVTGRIDLLYRDENGRWCVVDYKLTRKGTDAKDLDELAREYGGQLDLYRRIVESWNGGPMGRLGLWLAASGTGAWVDVG